MNYPIYLRFSSEDKAWIAEIPDLPGCMADGKTQAQALTAAKEAIGLWLEVAKADGREIPKPSQEDEPSGRFVVRIPRSLHGRLQALAKRERVSLNQLVLTILAAQEARRSTARADAKSGKATRAVTDSTPRKRRTG
jgi:antitoxin HicB